MIKAWSDAITRGDADAVRDLLRRGVEVDARDRHGQTALMLAAHAGHRDVVAALVEYGAALDVTAKYGLCALMLAVVAGRPEMARHRARAGADPSRRGTGAPGFAGKTARDLALARGDDALAAELVEPETVLAFWFGAAAGDPATASARESFWFGVSPETDALVRGQFAIAVETAASGALDGWLGQPRSALALVLLLDQFPRNIHRGTAAAFACDARARAAARHATGAGYLEALGPLESSFLLLPYQHSESLDDQRESVRLAARLRAEAPPAWRPVLTEYLAFAQQHLALIERFGRFPHRNAVLGRTSTAGELAHLASGGTSFGQGPG
jgi:uncharacterized protein (DUF924 family)